MYVTRGKDSEMVNVAAEGNNNKMIQFQPEMDENWWRYGGKLVTR